MVKKHFLIFFAGLLLSCKLPTDPLENFDIAELNILPLVNNKTVFALDDTLSVSLQLRNPHLISYITTYFNSLDSQINILNFSQTDIDTFEFKKVLKTSGLFNIKFTATLQNGETRSDTISITVKGVPPVITKDLPPVLYTDIGKPCSLSVDVLSSTALEYYWFKVGNADTIGKGNPLILKTITSADSGVYYCVIKNEFDTVTSKEIVLVIHETTGKSIYWIQGSFTDSLFEGDSITINLKNRFIKPAAQTVTLAIKQPSQRVSLTGDSLLTFKAAAYDSGTYQIPLSLSSTTETDSTLFNFKVIAKYCSLTVTSDTGSVTATPQKTVYRFGDTISLAATPNTGFEFSSWSGGIAGFVTPYKFRIIRHTLVHAHFIPVGTVSDCTPIQPNSSLNASIRAASTGTRPKTLCPQPGLYENGTIKINGKIKIVIK